MFWISRFLSADIIFGTRILLDLFALPSHFGLTPSPAFCRTYLHTIQTLHTENNSNSQNLLFILEAMFKLDDCSNDRLTEIILWVLGEFGGIYQKDLDLLLISKKIISLTQKARCNSHFFRQGSLFWSFFNPFRVASTLKCIGISALTKITVRDRKKLGESTLSFLNQLQKPANELVLSQSIHEAILFITLVKATKDPQLKHYQWMIHPLPDIQFDDTFFIDEYTNKHPSRFPYILPHERSNDDMDPLGRSFFEKTKLSPHLKTESYESPIVPLYNSPFEK